MILFRVFHVFGLLATMLLGLQLVLASLDMSLIPPPGTVRWGVMLGTILWAIASHAFTVFRYFEGEKDRGAL